MSMTRETPITVLMVDDDGDDRLLVRDAFRSGGFDTDLRFVADGEELFRYLRREGQYANAARSPRPGLILMDLNMPRMDGREALGRIKSDPALRGIPVVVMTTSDQAADVAACYDSGANSYITKPITFAGLVEVMRGLGRYWIEIVELPE